MSNFPAFYEHNRDRPTNNRRCKVIENEMHKGVWIGKTRLNGPLVKHGNINISVLTLFFQTLPILRAFFSVRYSVSSEQLK